MGKGIFKSIDPHDINIMPFKAHKSWAFESVNDLAALDIDRYQAIKPDSSKFTGGTATLDSTETLFDSSSLYWNAIDSRPAALHWYSLNNMYYKRENEPYESFGISDISHTRYLYDNASILSIPQKRFGERIKPGSVIIRYESSDLYNSTVNLIDDGRGNLIDSDLPDPITGQVLYLGFNSMTYAPNYRTDTIVNSELNSRNGAIDQIIVDTKIPNLSVTSKNVWIAPKSLPSGSITPWGNSALFYRDGYIRIENNKDLNFRASQDYAVSFWLDVRNESEDFSYILTKRSTTKAGVLTNSKVINVIDTTDVQLKSQYPYEITYDAAALELKCKYSTGTDTLTLTTSLIVNSKTHVTLQKTGSQFELYIDGALSDSGIVPVGNIHNDSDIFIGSLGTGMTLNGDYTGAQAAIDEFFMFNKALTVSEIQQLAYVSDNNLMTTNSNIVGNVYYEHGIVVISDPRPKYGTSTLRLFNDVLYNSDTLNVLPSILDSFYFEYKSTVQIFEHEYMVKLKSDEFNFTMNPTIRVDDDMSSQMPKSFVSNTEFSPYITTIGLYNKYGQLLAVAKLGTPIKKRDDVDLTFIIKFDS